jgi:hypothetical protein
MPEVEGRAGEVIAALCRPRSRAAVVFEVVNQLDRGSSKITVRSAPGIEREPGESENLWVESAAGVNACCR